MKDLPIGNAFASALRLGLPCTSNNIYSFILNGLLQANKILEDDVFKLEDWKVIGEYVYDDQGGRHQAFYSPLRDIDYKNFHFKAGERIQVEQSLKYSTEEANQLWNFAGLSHVKQWSASSDSYSTYLFASFPSICFFALSIASSLVAQNEAPRSFHPSV